MKGTPSWSRRSGLRAFEIATIMTPDDGSPETLQNIALLFGRRWTYTFTLTARGSDIENYSDAFNHLLDNFNP